MDRELSETNKNYQVARKKALKGVRVEVVPAERFYQWSETTKQLGGQTKIPRVMKEQDFLEFEMFMNNRVNAAT